MASASVAADPARPGLANFAAMKRDHKLDWPLHSNEIVVGKGLLEQLLRLALAHVKVDDRYYLHAYPDVVEALEAGLFENSRHHYLAFGYFEDRLPFQIEVDEDFYFRSNPDIKAGVSAGRVPSAQLHFERHGFKEGRLPREGWSLLDG